MTINKDDLRGHTIYLYKMTTDNGGAPCVYTGVLSLAICKPQIRTSAKLGDWIVGFGGKSVPELKGRLIYIAKVTKVADNGTYYSENEYRPRPDCVYSRDESGYKWRDGSKYHGPDQLERDLGAPDSFGNARVLLSDVFVYSGKKLQPSIERIKDVYEGLPRNFVRNHTNETRTRMEQFIVDVVNEYSTNPPGQPTQRDMARRCNQSEGDIVKC